MVGWYGCLVRLVRLGEPLVGTWNDGCAFQTVRLARWVRTWERWQNYYATKSNPMCQHLSWYARLETSGAACIQHLGPGIHWFCRGRTVSSSCAMSKLCSMSAKSSKPSSTLSGRLLRSYGPFDWFEPVSSRPTRKRGKNWGRVGIRATPFVMIVSLCYVSLLFLHAAVFLHMFSVDWSLVTKCFRKQLNRFAKNTYGMLKCSLPYFARRIFLMCDEAGLVFATAATWCLGCTLCSACSQTLRFYYVLGSLVEDAMWWLC